MPATEPPTADHPDGEDVALVESRARLRLLAERVRNEDAPIIDLNPLTDAEEERRARARSSFYWFIREMFETVDNHPYVDGWHIGAIAECLQAVQRGQIRRLLINMPQRHMKSINVSVLFPCWIWVDTPWQKFIVGHHNKDLGKDLAFKNRQCLQSEKFLRWYGHLVELQRDSTGLGMFRNTAGGARRMTSVRGNITGEGGDFTIIDDIHDTQHAESDLDRQAGVDWTTKTMFSRVEQQKEARRVIAGQRVHPRDGYQAVIEHGGWVHLNIPGEFVSKKRCMIYLDGALFPDREDAKPGEPVLFFADPRENDGDVLWPGHIDPPELELMKTSLGRMYHAYVQQDPKAPEGAMFNTEDWQRVDPAAIPDDCRWVRAWDLASSEVKPGKKPDYSAGAKIGKSASTRMRFLANLVIKQEAAGAMVDIIVRTAERDGKEVPIVVELEGGSNSDYMLLHLKSKLDGYVVIGKRSTKSKVVRAEPVADQAGNGLWRVVDDSKLKAERQWITKFFAQLEDFPMSENDDMVDAVSLGSAYVDGKEKGVGMTLNRELQFVSTTEIITFFGEDSRSRFDKVTWIPPKRTNVCMGVAFDERDERGGAALYVAMPHAAHELRDIPIVFRLVPIPAGSSPSSVIALLEDGEFEFAKQITRRLVSPESTKLQESFARRYRARYATWDKDARAGFAQARDALEIDHRMPHPIFEAVQGRPKCLFVAHDAQVSRSWDERGLKSLVQGIEQYTAGDDKGAMVAQEYPALRAFLGIASVWFASADPRTRREEIDLRLPDGLADVAGEEAPLKGYSRSIALDLYRGEAERHLDDELASPGTWRKRRVG